MQAIALQAHNNQTLSMNTDQLRIKICQSMSHTLES